MSEIKFCRISTLIVRWDCSRDHIYNLLSKGMLRRWPLPGKTGLRGTRICMTSVLELEKTARDSK